MYSNCRMTKIEKTFKNNDLEIRLSSFIDNKQNIWFEGKETAQILANKDPDQAPKKTYIRKIQKRSSLNYPPKRRGIPKAMFITEPGFYELVFKSKLPIAKNFEIGYFHKYFHP